ncbi:MAG: hypothetical protein ACRETU_13315, partial [Steroidobacterales bacterium]
MTKTTMTIERISLSVAGACLALAGLSACGGGGGSDGVTQGPPPAIEISLTATAMAIQPGGTSQITATVNNDSAGGGVTWAVDCPTAPCGSIDPASSNSGVAVTYSAPTAQAVGNLAVTLTATSMSDATSSSSVTLTVSGLSVGV